MKLAEFCQRTRALTAPYGVTDGSKFRLKDYDPADTGGWESGDKKRAREALALGVEALADFQEKLYAQGRHAVLLIFQGMDAAGKDGVIKHVMSGVNPQGCRVVAFKTPSPEELRHDFLWRCWRQLPERGQIGIFNRSYYEETLIVRVHPELLERQRLPAKSVSRRLWQERWEDIRNFERYLTRNGIVVRKFFLHLSKAEQKRRFLKRLDDPDRHWKFSAADVAERAHWDAYQRAYEATIRHTATPEAPWFVVPADHKWFTRIVVAAAVVDTLRALDLRFPKVSAEELRQIRAARRALAKS